MVFSAPTFLFLFLPAVLTLVLLAPRGLRNTLLLASSLFFYAWGEADFVVVMLGSILFNYLVGLYLGRERTGRSLLLGLGVGGNLLLLGWFKYAGFLAENVEAALRTVGVSEVSLPLGALEGVHLPIGISFFTFQAISYLIDVHRREHPPQRNPVRLALFISLFPQLIAGPIVRYKELAEQLADRVIAVEGFAEGIRRFTIGLAKKVLIANALAIPADAIFGLPTEELSPSVAWFGVLCYALQIYFDFSGYSDMAIGLGRLFGFRIPENFDLPYCAASLTDFWRRWHMSLSRWFRDYLYIPLGGNRRGARRTYANLLIVFVLCGLWHGASWNFLVWGLFHGLFLMIERTGWGEWIGRAPRPIAHLYCLLAVTIAWVFFRADSLPHAWGFLAGMAGIAGGAEPALRDAALIVDFASLEVLVAFLVGAGWAVGLFDRRLRGLERWALSQPRARSWAWQPLTVWGSTTGLAALWLLCAMKLASRTYDPFLYFRF
jgi:alginate O-acetyltransferase complex protein AlgI